MRIKEQETRLTLQEHDDDDGEGDDDDDEENNAEKDTSDCVKWKIRNANLCT